MLEGWYEVGCHKNKVRAQNLSLLSLFLFLIGLSLLTGSVELTFVVGGAVVTTRGGVVAAAVVVRAGSMVASSGRGQEVSVANENERRRRGEGERTRREEKKTRPTE